MTDVKNPKQNVGIKKVSMATVPATVLMEIAVGMHEGSLKYGRHNYRAVGKIQTSIYYDATMRHLMDYWEGEDIDAASTLSHITKAITSLVVLRDAMIQGNVDDDRPPRAPKGWMEELNGRIVLLLEKYPDPVPAYRHVD